MAATYAKRPLPSKVVAMKERKRRKVEGRAGASRQPSGNDRKSRTSVNALAWTNVAMPDHLDDYEGFLGLEEVDHVDVVRDEGTGHVSFRAASLSGQPSNVATADDTEASDDLDIEDGEEWSGFDDDSQSADPSTRGSFGQRNAERAAKRAEEQRKKTKPIRGDQPNHSNGIFQSLSANYDEENEDFDISAWRSLDLSPDTLSSLSKLKFSSPTPIQRSAIPDILAGHDVIGKASTGSGKTLAFGIPILETFLEQRRAASSTDNGPLALVLSPTRELAHQLDKHLTALFSNVGFAGPSIATLTGGLSVQKQQRQLKHADIVIGTPGRLWEVICEGQGIIRALQGIQFLVVDEADRLLSEGHFKEVEEILSALDRRDTDEDPDDKLKHANKKIETGRQTLVFSATFDRNLQRKLANKSQPDHNLTSNKESLEYLVSKLNFRSDKPRFIDVNPVNQLATGLKEGLVECSGMEKDLYLYTLLLLHPNTRTLVFANSISAVRRLTPLLQQLSLPALPLHSGMPQKARLRSVERFTSGQGQSTSILVATDVAARGLDIPAVQLVIHYHLPRAADTYVHRSGRTARAGLPGTSILVCAPEEVAGVRRLVAKVHSSRGVTADADEAKKQGYFIRTLDLDRRIAGRLKPRVTLAKKIADAELAREKGKKDNTFLREAAEELGVEYSSDSDSRQKGRMGRGAGRKKKEKEARGLNKAELGGMKAELKGLLAKRVNVGVSERYLTGGGVDIDELLRRQKSSGTEFLGTVQDLGL